MINRSHASLILCFIILIPTLAEAINSDVKGSKDHPLTPRISNFYIDRYDENEFDYENFKTNNGKIRVEGRKFVIDYRIQTGVTPPGKIQILRNYQAKLKKVGADILLQGPYYDVFKITKDGNETWIKVDPGVYDGKRYTLTIVEKAGMTQKTSTSAEPDTKGVRFEQLQIIESSGKPLTSRQTKASGESKKFFYNKTQKLGIKALIKNESMETKKNLRVEFVADGKVTDTSVIASLEPGGAYEVESKYDVPDMGTHGVEIRLVEEQTKQVVAAIDGDLLGESDNSNVTGFVNPDFQIRDIAYQTNPERIAVEVQNNGYQVDKIIQFKAWYVDPYSSYSQNYQTDISVALGPGERKWISLIDPFSWPDAIDKPTLTFTVEIDSDQKITEVDEKNNSFQKDLCVPCGVHIDELSTYSLTAEPSNTRHLIIYGQFGNKRATKKVVFVNKNSGNLHVRNPKNWDSQSLDVYTAGLPYGTYNLVVYCSDPGDQSFNVFTSNYSNDFKRHRDKTKHYGKDHGLSARALANALADEFADDLNFQSLAIENLWVDQDVSGVTLKANISTRHPSYIFEKIIYEIWQVEPHIRLKYLELNIPTTPNPQQGHVDSLGNGMFEFKARFIRVGGEEISKSIIFRAQ
jgi:CARDB